MPRVALLAVADVLPHSLRRIEIAGRAPLLLIASGQAYHLMDDTCGHGAASLAEGELLGDEILCPHHRGGFDIRSGVATRAPCAQAQRCYAVSVDHGVLYAELD